MQNTKTMRTDADDKLDDAKEKILGAWHDLQAVLDPNTHGHEDFLDEFLQSVHSVSGRLYCLHKILDQEATQGSTEP